MALESYWPEYLRELREFRARAGAEEPELTAAGAALRRAPDDFYTATLSDAAALLDRVVPVNLTVDLSLRYNQHQTLLGRTHAALAAYTHDQLRNEVLANGG